MNAKTLSQIVFLCTIALASGCNSDDVTKLETKKAQNVSTPSWVAIEPIQCLGNPWEQAWLADHDGDHDAYPKDPTSPGLEPAELEIIKDYYRERGVTVSQGRNVPKFEAVCLACTCPEGHTLYLRVRDEDVATMVSLGFRAESPPE